MTVYFISDGEFVKIGYTKGEPSKRLKSLQTGHPKSLKLLKSVPGSDQLESMCHALLAEYRVTGEWFKLCRPVKVFMAFLLPQPENLADCCEPKKLYSVPSLDSVPSPERSRESIFSGKYSLRNVGKIHLRRSTVSSPGIVSWATFPTAVQEYLTVATELALIMNTTLCSQDSSQQMKSSVHKLIRLESKINFGTGHNFISQAIELGLDPVRFEDALVQFRIAHIISTSGSKDSD